MSSEVTKQTNTVTNLT